jgi:hypothetical protein
VLHARGTLHAQKVRHDPLSLSCDTCLNACWLIALFAEGCARMYVHASNSIIIFPITLHLCSFAVPVHFGDRILPLLRIPPFFPLKLSPGISTTRDVMLPSLAISIFPPHFLAGDFICSKLPRVGPTLLLVEEHVTYLPPVMSMISRGLLARPEGTSMVVTVAFSDKRSLFTVVMMHSPVAYAIGIQDS